MGRLANKDTIEVHDGVYLRAHGKKKIWHCYFRLDGDPFRKSTKTSDLARAKLLALEWYHEAKAKKLSGQKVQPVGFLKLKDDYLELIKGEGKFLYHSETIARHLEPFFSKYKDVAKIDSDAVVSYLTWRRNKGATQPKPQTLNRENTVLRQLLDHAAKRNWLGQVPPIKNFDEKSSRRRRPHFALEDYRILYRTSRKRAAEFEGQPLRTVSHWQRQLLHDYILFLANTGMRVDEAKTVCWKDIDFNDGSILLRHAGKTKSTRKVLARPTAMKALERIKERREAYLQRAGSSLRMDELVFSRPDGVSVKSFKKGFKELLRACGFKYKTVEDRHCLTSLRHTYATYRMTTKKGRRASLRALAKQMGTSEKMINQHYGHDEIEDYREELTS